MKKSSLSHIKKKCIKKKCIKKKCWSLFSLLVRLEESDSQGYGQCITCGRTYHYKEAQAGHFIAGRNNAILFERNGVHYQCYGCNICKNGNGVEYYEWMKKKYGDEEIQRLRILAKQTRQFSVEELQNFAIELTLKTSILLKEKNV